MPITVNGVPLVDLRVLPRSRAPGRPRSFGGAARPPVDRRDPWVKERDHAQTQAFHKTRPSDWGTDLINEVLYHG